VPILFKKYFLVLLLALLQCLMPLLHAHAGGLHVSSHVHMHIEGINLHHPAQAPEFTVDLSELPVVCAASEFKRDSVGEEVAAPVIAPAWRFPPAPAPILLAHSFSPVLGEASLYSGPPPSQAPPALSIS
jgi:hypothetical protein